MIDQGAVQIEEDHICHRMISSWCQVHDGAGCDRDDPIAQYQQQSDTQRVAAVDD
jgi:hypothetical protein